MKASLCFQVLMLVLSCCEIDRRAHLSHSSKYMQTPLVFNLSYINKEQALSECRNYSINLAASF